MELKEIELLLTKLERVGIGSCESCDKQLRIADLDIYNGTFLCPECMRKVVWQSEGVLELPA